MTIRTSLLRVLSRPAPPRRGAVAPMRGGPPARHPLILIIVSLAALGFASVILTAQFHGEDELGVYLTANWLAEAVFRGNWITFLSVLVGSYHPPGRFLLATLSFLLFGPSVFALRFPAIVLWVATCVLAADITRRQAGLRASLVTGLLLGASGLFSLETLGFGHGIATFWGLLFIWLKVKHPVWDLDSPVARRHYIIGGGILGLGFLWFTSFLPISGMYHLYFLYRAARGRDIDKLRHYLLLTLPFIFFYATYYLIFLGLPQYAVTHGIRDRAVGQLHQNIARSQSATLNLTSFIDNLRGLNWYHIPFVSWALLGLGLYGQWRYHRVLFLLLFPYALLFSFYIVDNTSQHFLSYYIWLLPFAVAAVWQWAHARGRDWQGVAVCFLIAACIAAAGFGYVATMRQYTEATYPYNLPAAVWGSGKWRTNLMRPLPTIASDLQRRLGPTEEWSVTIDGALPLYYFPDQRYVTVVTEESIQNGEVCLTVTTPDSDIQHLRAIVRSNQQSPFCNLKVERVITYSESFLEVVLVER